MVSCGCIVICRDTSGTRHHQLGGSYLPDRAAGEVHIQITIAAPAPSGFLRSRLRILLLPLRFEA
jgi:hypothetical protein